MRSTESWPASRWLLPGLIVFLCLVPTAGSPRWVQILAAAALVVALAGIAERLARWTLPGSSPAERLFLAGVHACAVSVVAVLALGSAGLLRPSLFRATAALGLLAARLVSEHARSTSVTPPASRSPGTAAERATLVALLAAALGGVLWYASAHWSTPPGPFSYDDRSYHLSTVATWWSSGDLATLKFSFGDSATTFYPIGSEILTWVLLAPFGGSDFAARFSQLPLALFELLGIYLVARRLEASRRGALCAVLLVLAIPRAIPQLALSAGNDHATALFVVASAHAALCLGRAPRLATAVYAGLALGLLAGTKYLGLLLAFPLGLAVVAGAMEGTRSFASGTGNADERPARRGRLPRLLTAAAGAALLVGGYSYARNAWVTGNPLYPLPIGLFGVDLLPGLDGATVAARRASEAYDLSLGEMLWGHLDLWGPTFRSILLPLALVAPLVALARRRRLGATRLLVLTLPPVLGALTWTATYDHRDIRYLLGAAVLGAAAAGWLLSRISGRMGTALRLGVAGAALLPWFIRGKGEPAALVAGAAVALAAWLAAFSGWRPVGGSPRPSAAIRLPLVALAGTVAIVLSVPLGQLVERYQHERLSADPAAEALDRLAGDGAAVAYGGSNEPYLFFGRSLENRVHIVPTSSGPEEMTYDWGGTARFPYQRVPGGRRLWLENLERLEIEWVVLVSRGHPPFERRWIERRPELFDAVYRDHRTTIWRYRAPVSRRLDEPRRSRP